MYENEFHSSTKSHQCRYSLCQVNFNFIEFIKKMIFMRIFRFRNEVRGIEKSFLEAEYHCRDGYVLVRKRKSRKSVRNLICQNRRWFGPRVACKEILTHAERQSTTNSQTQQQCDIDESANCEQLCMRRRSSNSTETEINTETLCYCHKGFRASGTRCFGEWKRTEIDSNMKLFSSPFPLMFPVHIRRYQRM